MSVSLKFVPVGQPALPALYVGPHPTATNPHEYVFETLDINADVQVETFHASLPDALRQVCASMDPRITYEVVDQL